jgi:hypothetical protein
LVEILVLEILILTVFFQIKDLRHIHHLPPMHWSAQHPGLRFTLPDILPWLPLSSVSSNVAAGYQTILQTISKLREGTPSIYMDGIYKDDEKLPNYEIRYAHILDITCKISVDLMSYSSQDNFMCEV